jgi:hypothetical protein
VRFQIRDADFGLALYDAENAREALLDFIADKERGAARLAVEDVPDGEAALTWKGERYTTARVPDPVVGKDGPDRG